MFLQAKAPNCYPYKRRKCSSTISIWLRQPHGNFLFVEITCQCQTFIEYSGWTQERIGQKIQTVSPSWEKDLQESEVEFVIIGIPEDIGVRANYGRAGASTAYKPTLESFLTQQSNEFFTGENICVLGEVFVDDLIEASLNLNTKNREDISELRKFVSEIDERVSLIISKIISFGKIPIIVGGGHNNAFGNIKGASIALGKKVSAINCDAHLDFRPLEGRHSGNGFSYAFENNYLNKYSVLGMHEQYNSSYAIEKFKINSNRLFYHTYESVFVREELDFKTALRQCIGFVKDDVCGVEIDLDSITNVPTSAKTSSGISPIQARQYVYQSAKNLNTIYFHIAEGAPILSHIKADNKTGKLIAYLITDFIKGVLSK